MIGFCKQCGRWAGFGKDYCPLCFGKLEENRLAWEANERQRQQDAARLAAQQEEQRTRNLRAQREHEIASQVRTTLISNVPGITNAQVESSTAACIDDLQQQHPTGTYPEQLKLNVTVVKASDAPKVGFAFGLGSMPDVLESPSAGRIAFAGLEQWQAGAGKHAEEFVKVVLEVVNRGETTRVLRKREIAGIADWRWTEVIATTCIFAVYAERTYQQSLGVTPFMQVDAFACRCKHKALDKFTASTDDQVWLFVQPPFDWMCACNLVGLSEIDIPRPKYASTPGLQRLSTQRLQVANRWRQKSPETAFLLL